MKEKTSNLKWKVGGTVRFEIPTNKVFFDNNVFIGENDV